VRIFKTRWLAKFVRGERIDDAGLIEAIERAERGLVDADLGGGLIKQRVARKGQGRSGGYRMIIAYRIKDRAIFLYGFAKNERANISPQQLAELQALAQGWLAASAATVKLNLASGALEEVEYDEDSKA
jgi:hypothetical protein